MSPTASTRHRHQWPRGTEKGGAEMTPARSTRCQKVRNSPVGSVGLATFGHDVVGYWRRDTVNGCAAIGDARGHCQHVVRESESRHGESVEPCDFLGGEIHIEGADVVVELRKPSRPNND